MDTYARTGDAGSHSGLASPALRDCADETAAQLRKGSTPCLCHNDVHHLNIVGSAPVRLIDWEYAGVGEPLFDLASVCVYHRYRKPQRERLLTAYAAPSKRSAGSASSWRAGCSTTSAICGWR